MNVVPKGSPLPDPNAGPSPAQAARERAIAKITGASTSIPSQASEQPVPNATQISPEEFGAIQRSASKNTSESEAPVSTEESESPAKEVPLSSQHAILARKERALRAQAQQLKAEKDALAAERASYKTPEVDYSKYIDREKLKSDPMAIFDEVGLSYDDLTQAVLGRSQMNTDPRVLRQIEEARNEAKLVKEELAKIREEQKSGQEQSYKQAVANIRAEASKLTFTDPSFEMIKATNSVSDVVELIEETFKADGVLMSVEEACQAVEDHLLEEAMKLTKVKKLQQRLGQSTATPPVNNQKQPQSGPKTLTNGMTAQRPMSAKERAMAAFEGKLKG